MHKVFLFSGKLATPFEALAGKGAVDLGRWIDRSWSTQNPRAAAQESASRTEAHTVVIKAIELRVDVDRNSIRVQTKFRPFTVGVDGAFRSSHAISHEALDRKS